MQSTNSVNDPYQEGRNHYTKTYHSPTPIEYTLMGMSLEDKIRFFEGTLSDRLNGQQDDLYRILLLMIKDIKDLLDNK